MNYLLSGESSAIKKILSPKYQKYIATAINIAPLVLSSVSGLLAIAFVKLFRLSDDITGGSDIDSGTDSAISFLLGLLFSVELGTRLFSVAAFQQQLKLASDLMPKKNRDLIYQITTTKSIPKERTTILLNDIDLKEPNFLSFISTLYNTAGLNTLTNETHLRWVLFDLTVFYHVVIRAYAIAGSDISDMSIFASVLSVSYMHFFIIMMMFSTTDSIFDIYHTQFISEQLQVPAKNAFKCISVLLSKLNDIEEKYKVDEKKRADDQARNPLKIALVSPKEVSCEAFQKDLYTKDNEKKTL